MLASVALLAVTACGSSDESDSADQAVNPVTSCAEENTDAEMRKMNDYIQSPEGFAARTEVSKGEVSAVVVAIAPIELGDDGTSPTLPVGPCQRIYRFAMQDVPAGEGGVEGPFPYMEIDWNTEGLARGPNGSFTYPHYDFHFYLRDAEFMQSLTCVPLPPTDRVCDPLRTDYERMRKFQNLVPQEYLPSTYRADVGSAIPKMGLHYLDSAIKYTVDHVNNNPTMLYGSYDGKIVFAEASVTIFNLANVKAARDQTLSWSYPQPTKFASETGWPTTFTLTYVPETDQFEAAFTGFVREES